MALNPKEGGREEDPRHGSSSSAGSKPTQDAAELIDLRIRSLSDWRGETLAAVRRLIHEADPEIVEEVKWMKPSNPFGVPVWSHAGIVCTGETYARAVKLTFARGASLEDPGGLFNASLEAGTRRAIDLREGDTLDAEAFRQLIRTAVEENVRVGTSRKRGRGTGST
jgi:hypothetical protein